MKHRERLLFCFAWIYLQQSGCSNDGVSTDASSTVPIKEAGRSAEAGRFSGNDEKSGVDAVSADCCSNDEGSEDSSLTNLSRSEAAIANDANPGLGSGTLLDSASAVDGIGIKDSSASIDSGRSPSCPNLSEYRFDREIVLRETPAEASGIAWNSDSNTFFVVANLQRKFWEYDGDFQTPLRTIAIENMDIDTEGIVYLGEEWVAIAAENNYVYVIDLSDGVTIISGTDSNRVQPFQLSGAPPVVNAGLEGVAYLPPREGSNGRIFSCQEHSPMRVLQFEYRPPPPPFEPQSAIDGTLEVEEPWDAQRLLSANVTDIAGMTYDESSDTLLIFSQQSRSVIRVNPHTGAVTETLTLYNADTSEGVTLFDDCQLAIVSEPNRVQIYRSGNR